MNVLWVSDGKAGHENQVLGLLERMGELTDLSITKTAPISLFEGFTRSLNPTSEHYDFVIAAGSHTHTSLWWFGFQYRMPRVVVMRPSLLGHSANFRIIPAHDRVKSDAHTFVTQGPMNRVQAGDPGGPAIAVIGGISKHFSWDNAQVWNQMEPWLEAHPEAKIYDSRRTPDAYRHQLAERYPDQYVPVEQSRPGELASTMSQARAIWVTPDSASMVFEAWSTRAEVTRCEMNSLGTRVAKAVTGKAPAQPLNEAKRAAAWLLEKVENY